MSEKVTTAVEICGAGLVAVGLFSIFGAGVALIFAGIACMTFSYLAAK